ncbi:Ssh1 translocon complex protein [Malassezia pachydermatis]
MPPRALSDPSRLGVSNVRTIANMSERIRELVDEPVSFLREGMQFMNRCTKPDRKEFIQICRAVGTGFVVMGFIGYLVKLIHIPINNIVRIHCLFLRSLC